MHKRRRSEDGGDERPSNLEVGSLLTGPTKGATAGPAWFKGVPTISTDNVVELGSQQLAVGDSADVATGEAIVLRGPKGVWTNPGLPAVTEVAVTHELDRTGHEPPPANRLGEEEVDVAGQNPTDPNWFWELLAEAGWDVW